MQVSSHNPGMFCWAELETKLDSGAKEFYAGLLSREYTDNPMSADMIFTIAQKSGGAVAAINQDNNYKTPSRWGVYISVSNADETAAAIQANGGTITRESFDVMTFGRMAAAQDPSGAVFQVWQPRGFAGYQIVNEPGAVCWNELRTRDTAAAASFYSAVFGYGIKSSDMGMPYTEFQIDGKSVAGMSSIEPDNPYVPPHWLVIFTVADCAASVDTAKSLGGKLFFGPTAVPGVGNFAVLADSQGAVFGIVD